VDGRWSQLPAHRRSEVLYRLAALLAEHTEEFALLESLDTGKPIRDAVAFDVRGRLRPSNSAPRPATSSPSQVYGVDARSLSYQSRRPWAS